MLNVGIVKEIKPFEGRVMLTPEGVGLLVRSGLTVYVEQGVGEKAGFPDLQYERAGGILLPTMEKIFEKAQLIIQVQPPHPVQFELLTDRHILLSFMNLTHQADRILSLLNTKSTFIAAELLQDDQGRYPVLNGVSEIAGKMSVFLAAMLLTPPEGGKGILLTATEVTKPATITILGAGTVGRTACKTATDMGIKVNVLTLKPEKIDQLKKELAPANVKPFSEELLEDLLPQTDVFLVAVHSLKKEYDVKITRKQIQLMEKGSVLIDVSVALSSIVETSHATNHDQPSFILDGIVHYCVPNMAALVPKTSSRVLTKKLVPYVKLLALKGLKEALLEEPGLIPAVGIYKGKITNRLVADYHEQDFYNIFELLEMNL
jgi:alanine dehydrogenase